MSVLTVYFSRKGENYFGGSIRSIAKGNTEVIAEYIQEAVGGDLFEIRTKQSYPSDYRECTDVAMDEKRANARPELVETLPSLDAYDTIFVGYPNWWGTCPMAVFSFLDQFDLNGKTLVPFCTNEGSGMGTSESDLRKNYPDAQIRKGLSISGSAVSSASNKTAAWAKENI